MRIKATITFILVMSSFFSRMQSEPNVQVKKDNGGLLTLQRIFNSKEFNTQRFGPTKWLKDNSGYTTLETSSAYKNAREIVKYHLKSGKRNVLITAQKLIPSGEKQPIRIENYWWAPNQKMLLIFTNSKRVWRRNTRGDFWVLQLQSGRLEKVGGCFPPSTLMFAKFSPDSTQVGYVCKNNLYVEDILTHKITQLTHNGSKTIINGTFDWVYEEEFSLRDGFRWSPDSKKIAFWQLGSSEVKKFFLINNTETLYPVVTPIPYPKVGETNSSCRVGVVSSKGGPITWIKLAEDTRNNYIARMDWAFSANELIIQQLNREQNTLKLMLADASTGKPRNILIEKDKAWVEVVDDLNWLKNGKFFTWISERDGWRHVYVISRDGTQIRCITPGKNDVIRIQNINEKKGWLYFIASPENPTQRFLYRVPLKRKNGKQRLTPKNVPGSHRYNISPNAQWAFHTYSSFDKPPVTSLIKLPEHKRTNMLVENTKLIEAVAKIQKSPVEFFRVNIGENTKLDGWCIKPPHFNPQKKYPLFFFVYGEPLSQTVTDRWSGKRTLWHWMLAQKGYVVMSIDNRGTACPRGRAWRKSIYKKIGIISSQDQAAAAKKILEQRPYLDPERVGIWGWSGGGSMSLNMIFRYPEIYNTAMAVAFVANQRYYDTIYQERYMGLLKKNREAFRQGSPITFAHQLKGNLLLIHGTGDDNVHYQNCEALINELIKSNKSFSMMAYPNRSHRISEGKNTTLHLYTLLTNYLLTHMPPDSQ